MASSSYIASSAAINETVNSFLSRLKVSITVSDFLNYENNYDWIIGEYDDIDKSDNSTAMSGKTGDLTIKPFTTLYLPKSKVKVEDIAIASEGQVAYQKDSKLYLGTHGELLQDSRYIRSNKTIIKDNNISISIINENARVWWYCFALDEIIDITPFITNLSTSKSTSGNFSFNILPTRADLLKVNPYSDNQYLNMFPVESDEDTYFADYFETYFQENDVVFIRFEELEIDKVGSNTIKNLYIPKSMLGKEPSLCWDMIGLIDVSQTSYSAANNSKMLSVNGRDLTKLFEEDGSYFLPYQFIQGKDDAHKFVYGGDENSSWFRRNMISGDFNSFFSYDLKQIEHVLKFIVNHLSNLGITPNNLWDAYDGRRTRAYEISGQDNNFVGSSEVNGIWGIVQLNFDTTINDRMVTGENMINPQGNLMTFIDSVCMKPLVEVIMDTYKDEFELTVRQPPFNKTSIQSVITEQSYIKISIDDLLDYTLNNENEFYSYYYIEPHGQIVGNEDSLFQSIIPIINLPFFCDRFGNRGYRISDSYINRSSVEGDNGKQKDNTIKTLIDGLLNDMMYVIESTVYLPFTRKGTITLNGDRRIKVGSFILNEATNELFYVNGVSNNLSISNTSIERTTTLNVSRGMIVSNIKKNNNNYSYFDIVDVTKLKEKIYQSINRSSKSTDFDIIVNEEAFDYFTKRSHINKKFV